MYERKITKPGDKNGKLTIIERAPSIPGRSGARWLCKCDCGNTTIVYAGHFRAGQRVSCGCFKEDHIRATGIKAVWHHYNSKSKKRQIPFQLSVKEVENLIFQPCLYCGDTETNFITRQKSEKIQIRYTGMDRVDTKGPYSLENTVPCCQHCNRSKGDRTLEKWQDHVRRIYNKMNLGR